jgi:hypothetical protein
MRRRLIQFGIPVATLLLGGLIGFGAGQTKGIDWGTRLLTMELGYGLFVHSEIASLIRVGDTERALWWLDQWIDTSVQTLAREPENISTLQGLQIARVYRAAVPPTGPTASAVTAALEPVPVLEPPFLCPTPVGGDTMASGLNRLVEGESR